MSTSIRRSYVDSPRGQMHVRRAGEGNTWPLVLLHQAPSSGAMWDPVLPGFAARGYDAISPDLYGHGNSDYHAPRIPLHVYAEGVWSAMDALGVQAAALVGHHSGASLAVAMALEQPRRVPALALWGVPVLTEESRTRLANEEPVDWTSGDHVVAYRWQRRKQFSGPGWSPEVGRRGIMELCQSAPYTNALHNTVANEPVEDLLPRLRQPTLFFCGPGDMLFAASERASRTVPNGTYVCMDHAWLDVADQDPGGFVEVVDRFLKQHLTR